MKVTQHLWFQSGMKEAVRKYISLVDNSSIEWEHPIPVDSPGGPAGSIDQIAFTLGGQHYMALETPSDFKLNESFSILVEVADQAALDRVYDALLEGGIAQPCGWLKDRWGLSWQIVPKQLQEMMLGPDKEAAKRVLNAMLQMMKIDLAALQAAAKG